MHVSHFKVLTAVHVHTLRPYPSYRRFNLSPSHQLNEVQQEAFQTDVVIPVRLRLEAAELARHFNKPDKHSVPACYVW